MKEEGKDRIDGLFEGFNGQWDTEEPTLGHHNRFMQRLEGKKKKKFGFMRIASSVAAVVLMVIGFVTVYNNGLTNGLAENKLSPKNRETQQYFAMVINKELAKVEKENSPETKTLVHDALQRMDALDKDYARLQDELAEKGENKKIIHAMITNLQTRVSFLEEVLTRIENIKKIKNNYHENNS
jgi:hypothetical protein